MAIHWTIPFKSLRSGTNYTVNIYDSTYSGNPIPLKGGAQPFSTQESDDDDQFTPVRTQSGYLRIVDDGKDANGNAFNWKDMLPLTDTDRPVTLTDGSNNVVWQGFMQAQNFGGVLYGNPQEREYPIQCALTILEGTDINFTQKQIQNFAYLLLQIINAIPTLSITQIIMHGYNSWEWLRMRIDWQNYVNEENDDTLSARFDLFTCLQDMCRFWGWTARTFQQSLYFTQADDPNENEDYITITMAQLEAVATGTVYSAYSPVPAPMTLSGDIFVSVENNEYRQRGFSKATVSANTNKGDEEVITIDTDQFKEQTSGQGWGSLQPANPKDYRYTNDLLTYTTPFISGSCVSGKASFNIVRYYEHQVEVNYQEYCAIKFKEFFSGSGTVLCSLETVYEHCYSKNELEFHCETYYEGERMGDAMYIRVGIGRTRATAKWLNSMSGAQWTWGDTPTNIRVDVDPEKDTLWFYDNGSWSLSINVAEGLSGLLFIDFLGEVEGYLPFDWKKDICNFRIKMYHGPRFITNDPDSYTPTYIEDINSTRQYISTNGNKIRQEWNADCIFGSDNKTLFGYGLLIRPATGGGKYMETVSHDGQNDVYQEQYLADRVTTFWAASKRMIKSELRADVEISHRAIGSLTPIDTVYLDGTKLAPIAFGREWRDDVTIITMLEMPQS